MTRVKAVILRTVVYLKKIFNELYNELSEGRSAVLVVLTASSGSTPRGAGAKMLVFSEEIPLSCTIKAISSEEIRRNGI